nr:acyl-CoA-binding domain-containing protein 3-like isoform X1 [Ipomoea batatas]
MEKDTYLKSPIQQNCSLIKEENGKRVGPRPSFRSSILGDYALLWPSKSSTASTIPIFSTKILSLCCLRNMGIDTLFFQELAFTVGLSLMITFLLCKFFSSVVVEEDRNMSFCCGGAIPKAASNRAMDGGEMRIQHGVVQFGDRVKEERGVFEDSGVEDEAVKVGEELGKDQESILGCDGMEQKVFDESPVRGNFGVEDEAVKVDEELAKDEENLLGCDGMEQKVVDESAVRTKSREIEVELGDMGGGYSGEIGIEFGEREGVGKAPNKMENECSEDNDGLFDDDWEDIERTELEKSFDAAVVFVDSNANSDQFGNDLKMQLYGLHKIATDGPCSTAQPMALKVSARAKWTAWNSLGDISREEAMEQYIALLSSGITDWKTNMYCEDEIDTEISQYVEQTSYMHNLKPTFHETESFVVSTSLSAKGFALFFFSETVLAIPDQFPFVFGTQNKE